MNHYTVRNFKVVEINNSVALRSGHIIAQAKLLKADYLDGAQDFVENGAILFLDIDGQLKTLNNIDATTIALVPLLHFTEELMTGPITDLKYFAVDWESGNVAYPRALALNVGDSFITNNYVFNPGDAGATPAVAATTQSTAKYAYVNTNGNLEVIKAFPAPAAGYVGPIFSLVNTYLPDGSTAAFEFTVVNPMAVIAAEVVGG